MQHAISPVGADVSRHLSAIDASESSDRFHDQLQDQYRDELDADPCWLAELIEDGPKAQRLALYAAMVKHLSQTGADFMRGPLAELATPLQEIIAITFAERADKEIAKLKSDADEYQAERRIA